MIKIFGIKNCNTVAKAISWLTKNNIKYQFHDYKKAGISDEEINEFVKQFGWQKVLNSKGTTFRKLSEEEKPQDQKSAIALMKKQTSIIKRPIIKGDGIFLIGFDEDEYKKALNQ